MESIELKGDDYEKFSKLVYLDDFNHTNLSNLKNWEQPLKFRPNSDVLNQTKGGPCGLFAVLDAHIVLKRNESETSSSSQEHLLYSLILDIFQRVSTYSNSDDSNNETRYFFCDGFDPQRKIIHFQYTNSLDEAYAFLLQSNYTEAFNACLMITISIIFASLGIKDSEHIVFQNVPENPYIYGDKMTSMALVWLMLNGSTSSLNLQMTEDSNYSGLTQKQIGIKVLSNPDKRVVGTWLNPDASIFVCLRAFHFFVVVAEGENDLVVYDSMNSSSPYKGDKNRLNW